MFKISRLLKMKYKKKISELLNKVCFIPKLFNIYQVRKYKRKLAYTSALFNNYSDVLFVIQMFNKGMNVKNILKPFIQKKVKNIVAFADGCIDNSAFLLHREMKGSNHLVLQVNDLHEIRNYRFSLDIARNLNCKYVFLMQDDDFYEESIFDWIEKGKEIMDKDKKISIIGGASGANFIEKYNYTTIKNVDKFNSSEFKTYSNKNSEIIYEMEGFFKFKIPKTMPSRDFSSFEFVGSVNRAPQLIKVDLAKELNFFPKELEPFQYDDYYNCLNSWQNGYKVLLAPFSQKKSDINTGGMRLYNNINAKNRQSHFSRNYNFVISKFKNFINSGELKKLIIEANKNSSIYRE